MLIDTLEKKMAHPVASQIPAFMWEFVFKNFLDDKLIPDANKKLEDIKRNELPSNLRLAAPLLMIRYRDIPPSQLLDFMVNKLKLDMHSVIRDCLDLGQLEMLQFIEKNYPEKYVKIVYPLDQVLPKVLDDNFIGMFNYLFKQKCDSNVKNKSKMNSDIFAIAAKLNNTDILDALKKEMSNEELLEIIKSNNFDIVNTALINMNIDAVEWINKIAHEQVCSHLENDVNYTLNHYTTNEKPTSVKWLIRNLNIACFENAVSNSNNKGYTEPLYSYCQEMLVSLHAKNDEFLKKNPESKFDFSEDEREMRERYYLILKYLIRRNDPSLDQELHFLLSIPRLQEIADRDDILSTNGLLLEAMKIGNNSAIDKLLTIPSVLEKACTRRFCKSAVESGALAVIKKVKEVRPESYAEWGGNQVFFEMAARHKQSETGKWLLQDKDCLAHAESHHQQNGYAAIVYPFIQETLQTLHRERDELLNQQNNAVFNVDEEKAQQCFFIMRNLIRRNQPELNEEFRFLLDIPAVKAIAHRSDETGENALLRLANSTGNTQASTMLLNIDAVRRLAEQNNFYNDESRDGVDLRTLARNRESSMVSLTPGEAKRLDKAIKHYQPMLAEFGTSNVMDDLRTALIERYEANPATITVSARDENGQEIEKLITLPVNYEAFNALNLEADVLQRALLAYYENKNHTALRYIEKPNLWMNPAASFIYRNPDGTGWSAFEEFQDLISMMYMAAFDKRIEPIDGHTYEGRVSNFIEELALLGRAHNWDEKRIRNGQEEYYDDKNADKPSCSPGTKRRLFISVIGHPMLTILTNEIIRQELMKHIREHYKQVFTETYHKDFKTAFACMVDGDEIPLDIFKKLSELNFTPEKIEKVTVEILQDFSTKYVDIPLNFAAYIKEQFVLPTNNDDANKRRMHILHFYTDAGLKDILVADNKETKTSASGMFATQEQNEATSSNTEKDSAETKNNFKN